MTSASMFSAPRERSTETRGDSGLRSGRAGREVARDKDDHGATVAACRKPHGAAATPGAETRAGNRRAKTQSPERRRRRQEPPHRSPQSARAPAPQAVRQPPIGKRGGAQESNARQHRATTIAGRIAYRSRAWFSDLSPRSSARANRPGAPARNSPRGRRLSVPEQAPAIASMAAAARRHPWSPMHSLRPWASSRFVS